MKYAVVVLALVFMMGCGGGGGGTDLSCAPANPSAATVNLDGAWTLTLTQTSSTCAYPPDTITCNLTMSVSGNDVSISGTCTAAGITIAVDDISGLISGSTLYWGATMSATVDTYTETDTVPCIGVAFTSTESDTFNVTVSVEWSDSESGQSGTCSTSFSGVFT